MTTMTKSLAITELESRVQDPDYDALLWQFIITNVGGNCSQATQRWLLDKKNEALKAVAALQDSLDKVQAMP